MGFWSTIIKFIIAIIFILIVAVTIGTAPWSDKPMADVNGVTYLIGIALFQFEQYFVPFEIISLVLIAALIGAIFLAIKEVAT